VSSIWRRHLASRDFVAGCLFVAIGLLGLWFSADLSQGTLNRMGTGYFPRLICGALLVLGLATAVQGFRSAAQHEQHEGPLLPRAVILIPLALVAFGLTLERLGFIGAAGLMLAIGSAASRETTLKGFVVLAAGLIASAVLIFVWLLRLPIPLSPRF
jgi:hypothetical protein